MRFGRRRLRRPLLGALVVAATLAVATPPAGADPILELEDATELANKLAEATEEQGVCYGWYVLVSDDDGINSGVDTGSSLGPGVDALDPSCTPSVVFVAELSYTSELSESADSASFRVESTLPGFDTSRIDALGVSESALLGDKDDLTVFNATSLLPLLVAEQGLAPPVPIEQTTGTIPATDAPTGRGGSDRVRTFGALYFFAGFIVFAGVVWLAIALYVKSMQRVAPDFALSHLFEED